MEYFFVAFQNIGPESGTGHISRTTLLAKSIKEDLPEASVNFISNKKQKINGINCVFAETINDAILYLTLENKINPQTILFLDCLNFFEPYYPKLQKINCIKIAIDTTDQSNTFDIKINPVITNSTSYLNGFNYSFHPIPRKHYLQYKNKQLKVLVCFGGHDQHNFYLNFLEIASDFHHCHFDLIIANNVNPKKLDPYLANLDNVTLHSQPQNFYDLVESADCAIISGGILLHEVISRGIPMLVLPQYRHQKLIANSLTQKSKSIQVLEDLSLFKTKIKDMFDFCNNVTYKEINNLRSLNDGFGLNRVKDVLKIFYKLDWDSEFFNKEIYTLSTKNLSHNILNYIQFAASSKNIELIYFLLPKSNKKAIELAMANGFNPVDKRVTYQKILDTNEFNEQEFNNIFVAKEEDLDEIGLIAKSTTWTTRYFNDPLFPKKKLNYFYELWATKSIKGELDDIVFCYKANQRIYGYITLRFDKLNTASIGLISVKKDSTGMGIGLKLVNYAAYYALKYLKAASITVVTQKDNIAACKTYKKAGFFLASEDLWLHKWNRLN